MQSLHFFEELLLVGTHPEKGRVLISNKLEQSLAAALLIDGLFEDCIELTQTGIETRPRATEGEGGFVGGLLHSVELGLGAYRGRGAAPSTPNWLGMLASMGNLKGRCFEQLVAKGLVTTRKDRSSGLFVRTVYPHTNPRLREDLVANLLYLLANQQKPTGHQAILIKLLSPSLFYMKLLAPIPPHSRAGAVQHFFRIATTPVYHFGVEQYLPPDLIPRLRFRSNGRLNAAEIVSTWVEDLRLAISTNLGAAGRKSLFSQD